MLLSRRDLACWREVPGRRHHPVMIVLVVALRRPATLAVVASAMACASNPPSPAPVSTTVPGPPATAQPARRQPNEVRWVRSSAEYRAIALQLYRTAGVRVAELSRGRATGSWAVVLDADETVLDNSEYQRRRAALDSGYTEATWSSWVRERAATAVPGAVEFLRGVRGAGGRVAIVTNRADSLCAPTRENLRGVGIDADLVLCQPSGESDKNPRFGRIENGTAAPNVPPLAVVAWVGDNIQDFPQLRQTARDDAAALAMFGDRYFILPNPMYGSWERLPERQ
jgi:acid phosphatase